MRAVVAIVGAAVILCLVFVLSGIALAAVFPAALSYPIGVGAVSTNNPIGLVLGVLAAVHSARASMRAGSGASSKRDSPEANRAKYAGLAEIVQPFWNDAWHALCDKWYQQGYESLSADEKVWLNTRFLIDSTNNGGLISYYYNSGADTLDDCMAALDRLKANEVLRQVERVNALFPGGVPVSLDERNDIITSWDDDDPTIDALMNELHDVLAPLLERLEASLDDFVRTAGLVPQADLRDGRDASNGRDRTGSSDAK